MPDDKPVPDEKKQSDNPAPVAEMTREDPQPLGKVAPPKEQACCCDELVVFLDQIQCIHKTSTVGVSITDDEVQLTAIYSQPNFAPRSTKWPKFRDTYGFDNNSKTNSPLRFFLASFYPDHHCKLVGQLDVLLWRIKLTGDIVPVIQKALGEAALKFAPPGISFGDSIQKLIDDIIKRSGFGEHLIGLPISLPISIDFSCGKPPLKDRLADGLGSDVTGAGDDECTLIQEVIDSDGADYKVTLRFKRSCPSH